MRLAAGDNRGRIFFPERRFGKTKIAENMGLLLAHVTGYHLSLRPLLCSGPVVNLPGWQRGFISRLPKPAFRGPT